MSCCAACGCAILIDQTDNRPPPWCPRCGEKLKLVQKQPELRVPRAVAVAVPADDAITTAPTPAPAPPPRRPKLAREERKELPLPDGCVFDSLATRNGQARVERQNIATYLHVAAALFVVCLLMTLWSVGKLLTHHRAPGQVTSLVTTYSRRGTPRTTTIVSYQVGKQTFSVQGTWAVSFSSYAVGDRVTVLYPPSSPTEGTILRFLDLWMWPLLALAGTLFALVTAHEAAKLLPRPKAAC